MTEGQSYPNLVDRALRYLEPRSAASEVELCAHLFGVPQSQLAGPALRQWARLLRRCLEADQRFASPSPGRWELASATLRAGGGSSLEALEFVALVVAADGPKPWRDRAVGVSAVRVGGGDAHDRWESVTRPEEPRRVPGYLRDLGLGPATLEEAPAFGDVATELRAFLGGHPLVGVDIGLAVAYLQFELRRADLAALSNPLIDLAALARAVGVGGTGRRDRKLDLDALAAALDLPPTDRRSLASRARLSADVFRHLLALAARSGVGTLGDLRGLLAAEPAPASGLDATKARPLLDRSTLDSIATDPGVYLLLDSGGHALYVGKATCLRARLAAYFAADLGRSRGMAGVVDATAEIRTETTPTELEARLLEARLIDRLQPRYNVQRRLESELVYLRRTPPEELATGERWARLDRACTPGSLGPISSTEGTRLLAEARGAHRLGGRRGTPRWLERAAAAWTWLEAEVSRSIAVGGLTVRDLEAFALVAPWPPEPVADAVEAPAEDELAIGHEGWLLSGGGGDGSADVGDRGGGQAPALCAETDVGPGTDAASDDSPGSVARVGAVPRTDRRVVVLGKAGWLGSLTLGVGVSDGDLRRHAREVVERAEMSNPSAAVELAVGLSQLTRSGEAPILL